MKLPPALACVGLLLASLAHANGPAAVQTAPALLKAIAPSITVTGTVLSRAGADLAAPVTGRLLWVAEPGTVLGKGEVVARFDAAEPQLQRAEQQARIQRGEVAIRAAQREVERLAAAGNAIPRVQLASAEDARDLARSDLAIARAAIAQTEQRIGLAVLRAIAPGIIAQRLKRPGEEAQRGEIIARMESPSNLELRLFLPLRYVQQLSPGSRVTVFAAGRSAQAPVRSVVAAGDARSQSFDAYVNLAGTGLPLTSGDSVTALIPLAGQQQALVVPRDAVLIRQDGQYVMRLGKNAKGEAIAQRIPVRTGTALASEVAVEGALAANDEVVIRGAETLGDGDLVQRVKLGG